MWMGLAARVMMKMEEMEKKDCLIVARNIAFCDTFAPHRV
jgi:hypothetical protein